MFFPYHIENKLSCLSLHPRTQCQQPPWILIWLRNLNTVWREGGKREIKRTGYLKGFVPSNSDQGHFGDSGKSGYWGQVDAKRQEPPKEPTMKVIARKTQPKSKTGTKDVNRIEQNSWVPASKKGFCVYSAQGCLPPNLYRGAAHWKAFFVGGSGAGLTGSCLKFPESYSRRQN